MGKQAGRMGKEAGIDKRRDGRRTQMQGVERTNLPDLAPRAAACRTHRFLPATRQRPRTLLPTRSAACRPPTHEALHTRRLVSSRASVGAPWIGRCSSVEWQSMGRAARVEKCDRTSNDVPSGLRGDVAGPRSGKGSAWRTGIEEAGGRETIAQASPGMSSMLQPLMRADVVCRLLGCDARVLVYEVTSPSVGHIKMKR